MFNKTILVGNLTRDIELRYSQSGQAIANTAIATSRKYKAQNGEQKEEVMFIDLTFFGRTGEIANQYLRKGSKVLVEGRLMLGQWTDQSGNKRSKHSVTVETMKMLDSKADSANLGNPSQGGYSQPNQSGYNQGNDSYGGGSQGGYEATPSYGNNNQQQQQSTQSIPEIDINDDEIPF